MACMDYTEVEFLKMILRLKLDPARMQLLIGFFESYVRLTPAEEEEVRQKLTEILTSYHLVRAKIIFHKKDYYSNLIIHYCRQYCRLVAAGLRGFNKGYDAHCT